MNAPHPARLAKLLVGHAPRHRSQASLLARKARVAGIAVSLLAVAGLALLSGCGGSSSNGAAGTQVGEHCADLLAQAFSSSTPVPGAFACQNAAEQQNAQSAGIKTDADIAAFAQSLGWTKAADIGGGDGVFFYDMSGASADILLVYVDSNGQVAHFQHATRP